MLHDIVQWMRSSLVVRASDCQCQSRNGPGFDPSIFGQAVLNIVFQILKNPNFKKRKKEKKIIQLSVLPSLNKKKVIFMWCCAGGPSHVHNDPVRFDPGQPEDQRQRVRGDGPSQWNLSSHLHKKTWNKNRLGVWDLLFFVCNYTHDMRQQCTMNTTKFMLFAKNFI
jgi:hypothetical protein